MEDDMSDHPYREVNTNPMQGDLVEAVANGPHSLWVQFDSRFEGARWQRIHEAVSADVFESQAATYSGRELEALAYGYGYSRADAYLVDTQGMSEDDITADSVESAYRQELFGDLAQGGYFSTVYQSQSVLHENARTPQANTFVNQLVIRIEEAFSAGRDARMSEAVQSEAEESVFSAAP
jgi:hypothetical protein